MDIGNSTQPSVFVFLGLTQDNKVSQFLFLLFFLVYLMTLSGNLSLMMVVHVSSSLHTPMYYFLSYLSVVDLLYSSTITPKMLADLISLRKTISFRGCATQFCFFAGLAGTEVLLLSSMSYDRYIAICHPLHYALIMTKRKCLTLVVLSFNFGFFQSLVQTRCVFSLRYCGSNLIEHFLCDVPPMLQLSCSNTFHCSVITMCCVGIYCLYSGSTIFMSYGFILTSILRINSSEGRRKAFSTCSSHLMCSTIFFVTVFFTYMSSPSSLLEKQDKVASVFYCVVTPMLNPLIYSLRNQEVKKVLLQASHNIKHVTMKLNRKRPTQEAF
ncbi:olfactory receptor 5AR1-like [Gastrophryne carolinensis]